MRFVRCPDPPRWRAALSARLDGEESLPAAEVDQHLGDCAECAEWYARTQRLTQQLRAPHRSDPDLTRQLIDVTEAHICGCHRGEPCECSNCQCADCTCGRTAG